MDIPRYTHTVLYIAIESLDIGYNIMTRDFLSAINFSNNKYLRLKVIGGVSAFIPG
jgi:hypothetical protein